MSFSENEKSDGERGWLSNIFSEKGMVDQINLGTTVLL
jgi:hypothetical protein